MGLESDHWLDKEVALVVQHDLLLYEFYDSLYRRHFAIPKNSRYYILLKIYTFFENCHILGVYCALFCSR
jgi:hypothetical protein